MNSQVSTFLSLVYASGASRIALCLIPPDHQRPEHRFTAVSGLSRFLSYAAYRNANGWGVYVTPSALKPTARTRRKESFLKTQQVVYLDCDQPGCLDQIKDRYPDPTLEDILHSQFGRSQPHPTRPIDRRAFDVDTREYWRWRGNNQ